MSIYKLFLGIVLILSLSLLGCTGSARFTSKEFKDSNDKTNEISNIYDSKISIVQEGVASYYGDQFDGKKTANGEIFNKNELSAAHRTIPLGSIARVTNLKNNKKIIVKINDRGPFVGGRILDLSEKAAKDLDFINDGTTQVKIEVLKLGDNQYKK